MSNYEILQEQIKNLHDLTEDTCKFCGGSYTENLNGATSYFNLENNHFKITIEQVN